MRPIFLTLTIAALAMTLTACPKKKEEAPAPGASASAAPSASAAATAAAPERKPGAMPWDFPSGPTTAKKDDYVLVPSRQFIDDAFLKGADKASFIYYTAKMLEPGAVESKVKSLAGTEFSAPNAFIIPLKTGQKAKTGDIVLTWWQSGSGMQRSVVIGGTPEEPKVLHLDLSFDNPSGVAQKDNTLKKDSFHKVGSTLEPGVTIAVKNGKTYNHFIATAISGDKVLAIGFAGKMNVFKKSDCTVVPPQGTFAAGADVAVPNLGSYTKGKVDKVDAKIGRVFVKYTFGGKEKTTAIGLQDVSPLLPDM